MTFAQEEADLEEKIHILSTSGMIRRSAASPARKFIVATETGILYPLQKGNPDKVFVPLKEDAVCEYMKRITLEKVLRSLEEMVFQVKVAEDLAARGRTAIHRMLELT
jgi:quinolinate synthase